MFEKPGAMSKKYGPVPPVAVNGMVAVPIVPTMGMGVSLLEPLTCSTNCAEADDAKNVVNHSASAARTLKERIRRRQVLAVMRSPVRTRPHAQVVRPGKPALKRFCV